MSGQFGPEQSAISPHRASNTLFAGGRLPPDHGWHLPPKSRAISVSVPVATTGRPTPSHHVACVAGVS